MITTRYKRMLGFETKTLQPREQAETSVVAECPLLAYRIMVPSELKGKIAIDGEARIGRFTRRKLRWDGSRLELQPGTVLRTMEKITIRVKNTSKAEILVRLALVAEDASLETVETLSDPKWGWA